jgi:putative heme transporter
MSKKFKVWLNVFTIVALLGLVFAARHQISDAFSELADLNYLWLLMIIPLQIGNYSSVAMYYKSYLRNLGTEVPYRSMLRVALEMNFVNNVFPSGGASGFGYFGIRMKHYGVPTSRATLTQLMRHTLTFISFILYLSLALLILGLFGESNRLMIVVSSGIIFMIVTATLLLVYIISSSSRTKKFVAFIPKLINSVVHALKLKKTPAIDIDKIENMFEKLHHDYLLVHSNWPALKKPFMYTVLMNATELLTIMVVYFAFGKTINLGALIIAYAVANIAGLFAVLPGGVGIYEGLMTGVLTAAGIPKALALSTTIVYRVLNMAIFLPIGFVLYQLALRNRTSSGQNNESKINNSNDV